MFFTCKSVTVSVDAVTAYVVASANEKKITFIIIFHFVARQIWRSDSLHGNHTKFMVVEFMAMEKSQ